MLEKVFFLVSGENPTLTTAEVKAILEAERIKYASLSESTGLLQFDGPTGCIDKVVARSLMCKAGGIMMFQCRHDLDAIAKGVSQTDLSIYLSRGETFAVRVKRIGESRGAPRRLDIERFLGHHISTRTMARVSLTLPSKVFLGVISGSRFTLGLLRRVRARGEVASRRPRARPAFHPATMQPKLARCLVNLSRAREGGVFLDPFCGVGGILMEAGLMGCAVVGCDLKLKMLAGTRSNLRQYGIDALGIFTADARKLPLDYSDAIATDPPYGREASTLGYKISDIVRDFLSGASDVLSRGKYLSIVTPDELNVEEFAENAGFNLVEKHFIYVHRNLTRKVSVLRK